MSRWDIYVLCLCVVLSAGELLGPESRKDPEKSSDDEEEVIEGLDTNAQVNPEYLKQLTEAVNKEIITLQEYADAIRKTKGVLLSEEHHDPKKSIPENQLEQMEYTLKLLRKSLLRQTPPDEYPEIKGDNSEKYQDNPQDMLDSLPPLPEEEEPELTPELKEAKELYDAAMAKLNRRSPELRAAILQVKQAADRGYVPAKIKLAWSYLFGEGVEMDIDKAKAIFEELAEEGNGDAHAGMGFLYATGIGVPVSQAKALVHYTMGSLGDSDYAQMALAYRHWAGLTVPASCPKAMDIYMKVAAKVASKVTLSGGPAIMRTRLIDEAESGAGGALDTDLIEYYQLLAEKGDVQAQVGLGQLHFQGGRGVTLDINKALHYFNQAAKTGNPVAYAFLGKIYLEGGDGIQADNETALRYFKKAAELNNPVGQSGLGIMYLQGRGVPKDPNAAFKYFTMAANQGWVEGQLHLGFMYFGGIGLRRDFKQANKYFSLASQTGHVLALYHLGQMHAQGLGVMRSCTTAVEVLCSIQLLANGGYQRQLGQDHTLCQAQTTVSSFLDQFVTSVYNRLLAEWVHFPGTEQARREVAGVFESQYGVPGVLGLVDCTHIKIFPPSGPHGAQYKNRRKSAHTINVQLLFKNVCERGSWASRLMLAHASWRARDADSAFVQYLALAERGYEVAQSNAAFLLDNGEVRMFSEAERWRRALQLWSRAAAQGCSAARVKLGDYHYYGLGTPPDLEAAAHHYRIASEQLHNAQATFNLGYMHERGLGLARDLHLAKRCYDLAADTSPDARLPAALALARLNAHTALTQLYDSPLAVIFLSGESLLASNWDLYLITALLGALGLVLYLRRPQQAN